MCNGHPYLQGKKNNNDSVCKNDITIKTMNPNKNDQCLHDMNEYHIIAESDIYNITSLQQEQQLHQHEQYYHNLHRDNLEHDFNSKNYNYDV